MPSLVTHAYFALDVLEKLDENTKNYIIIFLCQIYHILNVYI